MKANTVKELTELFLWLITLLKYDKVILVCHLLHYFIILNPANIMHRLSL